MKIKISEQKYTTSNTALVFSYFTRWFSDWIGCSHSLLKYMPLVIHSYDLINTSYDKLSMKQTFVETSNFLKETHISGGKEYILKTTEVYDNFITIGLIQSVLGIVSESMEFIEEHHFDRILKTLHLSDIKPSTLQNILKMSTLAVLGLNIVFGSSERTIVASYGVKPLKLDYTGSSFETHPSAIEDTSSECEGFELINDQTLPLIENLE